MNDLVVRLLLKTQGFDADLGKAKKSAGDFASQIGGKLAGAVGKFAGALTAVAGSAMTFESIIRGSQKTSDEFDRVVRSVTTTVESFFTAISTGDFTSFNRGLDDIIARARTANDALDQLGNTTMSYNYFNARNQADFAEAITVLRDKNATADEKAAAKATADRIMGSQKEITEQLALRSRNAIAALVSEKNTLNLNKISRIDIDDVLALDVSSMGDTIKEDLKAAYNEYVGIYNKMKERYTTLEATSEIGVFNRVVNQEALDEAMQGITDKYKQAILFNEILVRNSDDWLQNLIQIQQTSDNAVRGMAQMERQLNRASQSGTGGGGSSSGGITSAVAGSLAAIDAEIKKAQQEYANTASAAAREAAMKTITELQNKKWLIELHARVTMPGVGNGKSGSLAALAQMPDMSKLKMPNFKSKKEEIEEMNRTLGSTGEIFGSLGGIMSSFGEDMGAWMLGTVGQIAQMIVQLNALATANGVASASKLPFPANIAAIATVVATIASVFSSLPKFAEGGVVGGSSYFGDKLIARVNSGETILTQNQAARALSMMNGGNVRVTGDVRLNGKDIYISLRNYMSASGNKL